MHSCLWGIIAMAVSLIILGFFLPQNSDNVPLNEKREMVWRIVQEEINSEIKNHLEAFEEMQKKSPLLQHAKYTLLSGVPPQKKKLLTVGISSGKRANGSYLLDTLQSLFQASSHQDLERITVLVLLSDPDPKWLSQTVANISGLFAQHIKAQELLVVRGLLGGSVLQSKDRFSSCEELYSRQKVDYALLMNFASNLSDYFLLLEDNIRCTPGFVSAIHWALLAWKELPWVILEFSRLSISSQVFHTSDLSRLTSVFLLFPKNTPTHLLLSEFRLLLAQNVPIHFSASIFSRMGSYSEFEDTCFPVEKDEVSGEPDNPVAVVLTDTMLTDTLPQYAYILNEDSFSFRNAEAGNYLIMILDSPHKVIRVAVLTGTEETELNQLQHGLVLLGSGLIEDLQYCSYYTLLGPLVKGNLDQSVFYEEDSAKELSCIKLLVSESQESWVLIRQIKIWTDAEEEEDYRVQRSF